VILSICLCVALARPFHQKKNHRLPGWGKVGHELTGAVAQTLIGAGAKAQVNQLLADYSGSLAAVAPWADTVRRDPAYAWSGPLHFINTPDWVCNYQRSRDCVDECGDPMFCVDGAIQNYTKRMGDTSIGSDQQEEALKFYVHFMGDIHQPLHCGFTSDRGGNSIVGYFYNRQDNLHSVWDTGIIMRRINNDFAGDQDSYASYIGQQISGPWSGMVPQWIQCNSSAPMDACSDQWGSEAIELACAYSYVDSDGVTHMEDGFLIEDPYYNRNLPIIEQQLAKAAVRMAHVMDKVWP